MDLAKDIEEYESYLKRELKLRVDAKHRYTMLKYEIKVQSSKEPRVIMNDIRALVAERYLIAIEDGEQ